MSTEAPEIKLSERPKLAFFLPRGISFHTHITAGNYTHSFLVSVLTNHNEGNFSTPSHAYTLQVHFFFFFLLFFSVQIHLIS